MRARALIHDRVKILRAEKSVLILVEQMKDEAKLVVVAELEHAVDAWVKIFVTHLFLVVLVEEVDDLRRHRCLAESEPDVGLELRLRDRHE